MPTYLPIGYRSFVDGTTRPVFVVWPLAGGKLVPVSFEGSRTASGRVRQREVVLIPLRGGPRGLS